MNHSDLTEVLIPLDSLADIQAVAEAVQAVLHYDEIAHTFDQVDVYDFFITYSLTLSDRLDIVQLKPRLHAGLTHVLATSNFTLTSSDDEGSQRLVVTLTRDPMLIRPTLWDYVKALFDDGPDLRA
jgi:hypothetical protein